MPVANARSPSPIFVISEVFASGTIGLSEYTTGFFSGCLTGCAGGTTGGFGTSTTGGMTGCAGIANVLCSISKSNWQQKEIRQIKSNNRLITKI